MTRQFLLPLPDNLDPLEVKCIKLEIPDDLQWQASFWGFLEGLAQWFTWERDADHTGAVMAEKYRTIIDQARIDMINGACDVGLEDVRQNEDDPCILEKKASGGSWVQFADISLCDGIKPRDKKLKWASCGAVTCYSWDDVTFFEFPDGNPTEGQIADDFGINKPVYATGVDKACVAANNVIAIVRSQVDGWKLAFATAGVLIAIQALIAAAVALVITAGAAAPLIAVMVAEILALGYQGITSQFDSSFFDLFQCDLDTAFSPDGIMTGASFATLYDVVQARIGGAGTEKWSITLAFLSIYGVTGLNNMANQANITECAYDPCTTSTVLDFNFRISPYANQFFPAAKTDITTGRAFPLPYMSWEAGLGWRSTGWTTEETQGPGIFRQMYLCGYMPTSIVGVTQIKMEYTFDRGKVNGGVNSNTLFGVNTLNYLVNENWLSTPTGYNDRTMYTGTITIAAGTYVSFRSYACGVSVYQQDMGGEFIIHRLRFIV